LSSSIIQELIVQLFSMMTLLPTLIEPGTPMSGVENELRIEESPIDVYEPVRMRLNSPRMTALYHTDDHEPT
jgi:hypothetical protein